MVARGKAARRLRDDRNAVFQTRVSPDIGLQIGGQVAQRIRGDVRDQVYRRLMIERRIRDRDVSKTAVKLTALKLTGLKWTRLKWAAVKRLLQGLRLEAQ